MVEECLTYVGTEGVDTGVSATDLATITLNPSAAGFSRQQASNLWLDIEQRLAGLNEVESFAIARSAPFEPRRHNMDRFAVPASPLEQTDWTPYNIVTSEYFDVLGIRFLRGRKFQSEDIHKIILNQAFAERLFPTQDPIGKVILKDSRPFEVIGVVANVSTHGPDQPPGVYAYIKESDESMNEGTVLLRCRSPHPSCLAALRTVLKTIDARLFSYGESSLAEHRANSLSAYSLYARLGSNAALFTLLLAALGTYGSISFWISSRLRELAVRSALGASPIQIVLYPLRKLVSLLLGSSLFGGIVTIAILRYVGRSNIVFPGEEGGLLACSFLVVCITMLLSAMIPSWKIASSSVSGILREN